MTSSVKLNIAIPTYKRPEQLVDCINSIAKQIEKYRECVSITIFDDSLSDINNDVINSAKSKYDIKLDYYKNKINYGIDGNIDNCLSSGDSEYILVLGEDDVLMPNALKIIIGMIEEYSPEIVYTSYVYLSNDKKRIIKSPLDIKGRQDPQIFIERNLWAIGFIGSVVVRRNFLLRNTNKYIGSYFNHVGRISANLQEGDVIVASEFPLVGNRSDDLSSTTWSKSYYDVLFGFERLMIQLSVDTIFGDSFISALASFRNAFGYLSLHRICLMRSYDVYNDRIFNKYIQNSVNINHKFIYSIISKMPSGLFVPLRTAFVAGRVLKRMTYAKNKLIRIG